MDLVWTRSKDSWPEDAPRILAGLPAGTRLLHLPCIRVRPLLRPMPPQVWPTHLVITSAAAARIWLAAGFRPPHGAEAPVFLTLGEPTTALLTDAGVQVVRPPAVRTGRDLAEWMLREVPVDARILVLAAAVPAYDIRAHLTAAGRTADSLALYETIQEVSDASGAVLDDSTRDSLGQTLQGVIAFASPSAVAAFAGRFSPWMSRLETTLTAAVIGPTTALAAGSCFGRVIQAQDNSAAALADAALRGLTPSAAP